MPEVRKKTEKMFDSERAEVTEHNPVKRKKKKMKSRENTADDEEIGTRKGENLGEEVVIKKKSKKKHKEKNVDSEAEDGVKKIKETKVDSEGEDGKSKKKHKEKNVDSEPEDGVKETNVDSESEDGVKKSKKKHKEMKVDSEPENGVKKIKVDSEGEDGVKKSKKKHKEKKVDSEPEDKVDSEGEDGVKKSKKKHKEKKKVDSEPEDGVKKIKVDSEGEDGMKKSKKKHKKIKLDFEADSNEVNQRNGKRKRDDSDLEADENTDSEIKKKKKKKKPSLDFEFEETKKKSEDSEVEENSKDSKKKKKKQRKDSEAEENDLNSTKESKKKKKQEEENNKNSTEDAKKKRKKKQKSSESDKDVTTPSSKSTKKVKFSDQVEVFPAEDEEEEDAEAEEGEGEEVELVRGKRFSKEEDAILKQAVLEYIDNHALGDEGLNMILHCKTHPQVKGCWKEIATALPWRPHASIYYRAHNMFEESSKGVWTKEDFELVKEFQKKHGNDWKTLGDAMGKHRVHVKDTWRRLRMNMKKGNWTREEYQTLFDLVNKEIRVKAFQEKHSKHGMLRDNIPWMAISDQHGTRDHVYCCDKWYSQLTSPMVAKGIWANVDDYRLLEELVKLDAACVDDVDWDNLLDNRDGEACRKRWNQMVLHIGTPVSKTFAEQVEILSERYCPELAEDREDFDNRPFDDDDED